MISQFRAATTIFLLLTLVTGVLYPALVTVVAQIAFPFQANGSVVVQQDKPVGSELIGQPFDNPKYFWGRPSGTSPAYNGASSTGTNLGPTNSSLLDAVRSRVNAIRKAQAGPVPVELVTASASGLDPHISPAAAEYQVARVARVRKINPQDVRRLVAEHTETRTFGLLGEPRVNVLRLNLALDAGRSPTAEGTAATSPGRAQP